MKFLKETWIVIVPLVLLMIGLLYLSAFLQKIYREQIYDHGYYVAYSQHRQGVLDNLVPLEFKQKYEMETSK